MESADVLIIGAGIFGLTTARTYLEAHPEANIIVIESASSVGGTWAQHRLYPGLKTNNILGTYESPDFPMHSAKFDIAPWSHIPGGVVHNYLAAYSDHFNVTRVIKFNSKVELVEQGPDDTWIITILNAASGASYQIHAEKLIVAAGVTGHPKYASDPRASDFNGPVFHAKEFLQRKELLTSAKSVVVYGGAKSAWDAVYSYASAGINVDWVIRDSGRGPCWMASPFVSPFKIWIEKLVFTRFLTWLSPCIWGASDGYDSIRRFLHNSILGNWIVKSFFDGIAADTLGLSNFDAHSETAKLKPWSGAFWCGTSLSMLNYPTDILDFVRNGQVKVHHATITSLSNKTVHLSTGVNVTADALHCSTGWKHEPPFKVSPPSLLQTLGLPHQANNTTTELQAKVDAEITTQFPMLKDQPNVTPYRKVATQIEDKLSLSSFRLYRFMVPPSTVFKRNFAVAGAMLSLGQPISAQIQALWITSYLDGTLDLPETTEEIEHNTELFVRYGRLRTPAGCGSKHGDMIFETMPYWDQLLQDIGLPFKRKASWLQEIFLPYETHDYKGLVQEWIQKKKQGKLNVWNGMVNDVNGHFDWNVD